MKLYEGMFLIEAGRVAKDWDETEQAIVTVIEKHGGTIKQANRYDERKLAYPVKKVRRGAYLLAYFEVDPDSLTDMREDLELSESILRYLILRVEGDAIPEPPMLGNVEPSEAFEEAAAADDEEADTDAEDEEDVEETEDLEEVKEK